MHRGIRYDPWRHAAALGVTVEEQRLPRGRRGEYVDDDRVILLARGMTRRQARSTLAHEVQHALRRDRPTPFGPLHQAAERAARRGAALLLVEPGEYAAAEATRGAHVPAIAYELEVTPLVVHDWLAIVRARSLVAS